jgi:predicted nucleic acid-binding Zn ribbon protein
MKKTCLICGAEFKGRADKRFCSIDCKNQHNFKKRRETKDEVKEIDAFLHRNREILWTLMGESQKEMFEKLVLERAKFRFEYHTGTYLNKEGKTYHLVYDFAWMEFSNQNILVVRKKSGLKSNATSGK